MRSKAGSVLILALWALFFLSALALAIGAYVSSALTMATSLRAETAAYGAARAGVDQAIQIIADDTNAWDDLTEDWAGAEELFRNVPLEGGSAYWLVNLAVDEAGATVTNFGLADEDRKVNLNRAETNLVAALLVRVGGVSAGSADGILAEIRQYWQRKAALRRQAEVLTGRVASGYSAPATDSVAGFQSLNELFLVPGVTRDLFARVEPYATVYGSGYVNLNTAEAVVLRCLADATDRGTSAGREALVGRVLAFRRLGDTGVFATNNLDVMWTALSRVGRAEEGEEAVFRGMQRMIGIRSAGFGGRALGRARGRGTDDAVIDFVFDRERGRKVFWLER
jgi:general secretion pathway protein K